MALEYAKNHKVMGIPHKSCDMTEEDNFYRQGGITNGADWYSVSGGLYFHFCHADIIVIVVIILTTSSYPHYHCHHHTDIVILSSSSSPSSSLLLLLSLFYHRIQYRHQHHHHNIHHNTHVYKYIFVLVSRLNINIIVAT